MTRLYLTRHGQTEWNLEGRMQGQKDSNLTTLGEKQAQWLGKRLKNTDIDIIVSSSSGRAMRTAEIIRGDRDIKILPNDNLKEINLGEWGGMLHTEVKQQHTEEHNFFWNYPHLYKPFGGETFLEVLSRVGNEIEKIIDTYKGNNILVVSHAIALKSLIAYFENKPLEELWTGTFMNSTCLNIIEINDDERRFILQGDTSHYEET